LRSRARDKEPETTRDYVKEQWEQESIPQAFLPAWQPTKNYGLGGSMSDLLHRVGRSRDLTQEDELWSSAWPNTGNWGLPNLSDLIEFAGLCGIAFCPGAGAGRYVRNSHFWTTGAIAATEDRPQIVNRSRKENRLPAALTDAWRRSADVQDGFGML